MTLRSSAPLRFEPYGATADVANIVVDGAPNASTVLTLTHWPGIAQPPGLAADLSAEMAFRYLDQRPEHDPASVVTNNHFDQDGLVGIFALTNPEEARRHRDVLIDVAAAVSWRRPDRLQLAASLNCRDRCNRPSSVGIEAVRRRFHFFT